MQGEKINALKIIEILELPGDFFSCLDGLRDTIEIENKLNDLRKKEQQHFRKLAYKYHPDKNPEGEIRMKEINYAHKLFKSIRYQPPQQAPQMVVMVQWVGNWDSGTSTTNWSDF